VTALRLTAYALLTSAVLSATACGGSTNQAAGTVLGKRFSAKVVAECTRAVAAKKAEPPFPFAAFNPTKPDLSKLPAIAGYEARGVLIFRTWERRMLALGSPPNGQKEWAALMKPLRAHTRIIADQQAAASHGDGAAFTGDYEAGNQAQEEMVRAAAAAGVPVCATAAGA